VIPPVMLKPTQHETRQSIYSTLVTMLAVTIPLALTLLIVLRPHISDYLIGKEVSSSNKPIVITFPIIKTHEHRTARQKLETMTEIQKAERRKGNPRRVLPKDVPEDESVMERDQPLNPPRPSPQIMTPTSPNTNDSHTISSKPEVKESREH